MNRPTTSFLVPALLLGCAVDLGIEKKDGQEDPATEDVPDADAIIDSTEVPEDAPAEVVHDSEDPEDEEPACESDVDGDGICDDEDICHLDGPLFAGIPDPAAHGFITIRNASLDGEGNVLLDLTAHQRFDLEYDWEYDSGSECCTCLTFISYGYSHLSSPEGCQPSFTGCNQSGSYSTWLRAPDTPGTYYMGGGSHWEYACPTSWDPPDESIRYAAICVE